MDALNAKLSTGRIEWSKYYGVWA